MGAPVSHDKATDRHGSGIACIGFQPFESGTLRGFGDFLVPAWHLQMLGCSCHCQGDRRWIGLPSKPLIDRGGHALRDESTGKIRYAPVVGFDDKEVLHRFSDAAIAALDVYRPGWWEGSQ